VEHGFHVKVVLTTLTWNFHVKESLKNKQKSLTLRVVLRSLTWNFHVKKSGKKKTKILNVEIPR